MLSDNQRRLICRISFILLYLVPTGFVVYSIFHRPTSADWARDMKAGLGIDATIDSIETPVPYVAILRGLKFSDPEQGTLFEATEVRVDFKSDENLITIEQNLHLSNLGLVALVRQINQHVIRRHQVHHPWRVKFRDQATIWDVAGLEASRGRPTRNITLEQIEVELKSGTEGTNTFISCQLADSNQELPLIYDRQAKDTIVAFLGRSRKNELGQVMQLIELDTRRENLPCWLLGDLVPELDSLLGKDCQFGGALSINPPTNDASRENIKLCLKGKLSGIDGGLIFERTLEHPRQNWEVLIRRCEVADGQIAIWDAELLDGYYRYEIPAAATLNEFNIRRAILASMPDDNFSPETKFR